MKALSAQAESCYVKPQKIMQHMHGNIPYMFNCWAYPVVHLLLQQSSMARYFYVKVLLCKGVTVISVGEAMDTYLLRRRYKITGINVKSLSYFFGRREVNISYCIQFRSATLDA